MNTNIQTNSQVNLIARKTRLLAIGVMAVAAFLMFSLAYTAQATVLTRQLELGMSGSDVSSLQAYLATDATIYPQGLITGYFGQLTKGAVSNFQSRNGIPVVGRVGPITLAALNSRMGGGFGVDNSAPVIGTLNISTTNSSATFAWNTSENASATIYYSTAPLAMTEGSPVSIGGTSYMANSDFQLTHIATLSGLNPNTTYYYVVYVRDVSGNENISWPSTFHTNP